MTEVTCRPGGAAVASRLLLTDLTVGRSPRNVGSRSPSSTRSPAGVEQRGAANDLPALRVEKSESGLRPPASRIRRGGAGHGPSNPQRANIASIPASKMIGTRPLPVHRCGGGGADVQWRPYQTCRAALLREDLNKTTPRSFPGGPRTISTDLCIAPPPISMSPTPISAPGSPPGDPSTRRTDAGPPMGAR